MPWYTRDVTLDFSRPGKLTDNAVIEAFNGRFRAECLNAHWFMSPEDARQKMEAWRRYYNEERPHDAIGQKAPITLLVHDGTSSPPSRRSPKTLTLADPRFGYGAMPNGVYLRLAETWGSGQGGPRCFVGRPDCAFGLGQLF